MKKYKFILSKLVILAVFCLAAGCAGPWSYDKGQKIPLLEHSQQQEPLFSFVHITDTHCMRTDRNIEPPPSEYTYFPLIGYKLVQWTDLVNSMAILEKTVEYINDAIKPDFVIHTGDIIHNGKIRSDMEASKKILANLKCPLYAVMGNHDVDEAFGRGQRQRCNYVELFGERCYSFDYNRWHFVAIGISPDDKEMDWLKCELLEHKDVPKVILTHKLVVSDELTLFLARKFRHVELMMPRAEQVKTLLKSSPNVVMVLSGHCHINLRWKDNDIVYISTGALGERPHQFRLFKVYPDRIEISIIRAENAEDVANAKWQSYGCEVIKN